MSFTIGKTSSPTKIKTDRTMAMYETQSLGSMNSSISPKGNKQKIKSQTIIPNPIFGYKVTKITATSPGTTIYRLDREVYNRFLDPSVIKDWFEKPLSSRFPNHLSFNGASKKVKEQIRNNMYLHVYEPNEIIRSAGEIPSVVHFLVSGRV